MIKKLFLIPFLFVSLIGSAQEKSGFSAMFFSDFSYSGSAIALSAAYQKGRHMVYVGPKFPFSIFPTTIKTGRGLLSGYRFYIKREEHKSNGFLNFDYQLGLSEAYNPEQESKKLNYLHQFNLSYGMQYKLSPSFTIGSSIGAGVFFNHMYVRSGQERKTYRGYDGLLRFSLAYNI